MFTPVFHEQHIGGKRKNLQLRGSGVRILDEPGKKIAEINGTRQLGFQREADTREGL
jgi:hypothetical protein